jgi:hypothetical protein
VLAEWKRQASIKGRWAKEDKTRENYHAEKELIRLECIRLEHLDRFFHCRRHCANAITGPETRPEGRRQSRDWRHKLLDRFFSRRVEQLDIEPEAARERSAKHAHLPDGRQHGLDSRQPV